MDATTEKDSKISLKIIVHKEENRVVYAEADYSFVDILFSFMTLPMGTIVRLLRKDPDEKFEALGSLNNLYQSLIDLPSKYVSSEECRYMLLNPRTSSYDHCKKLILNIDDTEPTKYFKCGNNGCNLYYHNKYTTCDAGRCRNCGKLMNLEVEFKDRTVGAGCIGGGVIVSDITNFIVTDDLRVMPYTSSCIIRLLIDLGITNHASHLEERTVDIGRDQILHLLKLALFVNSPLTYLLLRKSHPTQDLVHPERGSSDHYNLIKKEVFAKAEDFDDLVFPSTTVPRSIKVSLQKSTGKFLFAEAEEDFGDFVFGFFAIPLGTVIAMLMSDGSSLVCMENIYKSILNLSVGRHIESKQLKDILVRPQFMHRYISKKEFFPLKGSIFCHNYTTSFDPKDTRWPELSFVTCSRSTCCNGSCLDAQKMTCNEKGLLKRSGMFMVTDDLVVTPLSPASAMNILIKFKVPLNDIEEHEVSISYEEGLRMLKASLLSCSTFTNGLEHELKKLNHD